MASPRKCYRRLREFLAKHSRDLFDSEFSGGSERLQESKIGLLPSRCVPTCGCDRALDLLGQAVLEGDRGSGRSTSSKVPDSPPVPELSVPRMWQCLPQSSDVSQAPMGTPSAPFRVS